MKKFRFLLFIYFVGLTMGVNAYDFSVVNADGKTIYYNVISNTNLTCEVTYGTNKYSETVNVSASVSYNSKTYSVVEIGSKAFYYCNGLTSVEIPNSVTSIGSEAFSGCTGLTSVEIPSSVTSIGRYAFNYCSGLTSVTIPNSVTSIGEQAFRHCSGLTSVTIPNSVTSIDVYAFCDCDLTSVVVESGNKYYDSRENCNAIIETATNTLIQGSNTTIIPTSVTGFGNYAFSYCSGLETVDIPIGVTSFGYSTFFNCSGLTSVKVHWKRPLSIGGDSFNGVDNSKCTLYVPKGTEMLYWVTEGWSSFKNIVEYDEPEDVSYYITINGLEGGEIMQKVDIGMTYSYKFKPYEEWEINSVTFNGVDVTSQLQDSIFSTPAIAGNSALSVVYKKVSSAIDAVEGNDDIRVLATSGAIVINGAKAGKAVSVYGLNGNMVESTKTNGASTIVSLPQKGVYIVKVGNDVFKVSI